MEAKRVHIYCIGTVNNPAKRKNSFVCFEQRKQEN